MKNLPNLPSSDDSIFEQAEVIQIDKTNIKPSTCATRHDFKLNRNEVICSQCGLGFPIYPHQVTEDKDGIHFEYKGISYVVS